MSESILFLRADNNSFERYISENIRAKGFEVAEPYSVPVSDIYSLPFIKRVIFRHTFPSLYSFLIGDWKRRLSGYDTVIIFDKALTPQLVRYIRRFNSRCRIKVWLWNVRELEDDIRKHASVYTFDEQYALSEGYTYIPQFHFENAFVEGTVSQEGVFYAGFDKDRYQTLLGIAEELNSSGIRNRLILRKDISKEYDSESGGIILTDKDLDYKDILKQMNGYSCILELNIKGQSGLTLRSLEALFGNRKLITNNKAVRECDFYDPSNIYILDEENKESLKVFLAEEYRNVDPEIKKEYTFDSWLRRITEDKEG